MTQKSLDNGNETSNNKGKMSMIKLLKDMALNLSAYYENNIKIEIDTSYEKKSVSVKVTEFNI